MKWRGSISLVHTKRMGNNRNHLLKFQNGDRVAWKCLCCWLIISKFVSSVRRSKQWLTDIFASSFQLIFFFLASVIALRLKTWGANKDKRGREGCWGQGTLTAFSWLTKTSIAEWSLSAAFCIIQCILKYFRHLKTKQQSVEIQHVGKFWVKFLVKKLFLRDTITCCVHLGVCVF